MEALAIQGAFAMYLQRPALVTAYKDLDDEDLLILVKGTGFANGDAVNKLAAQLGWVERASYGWCWKQEWIEELRKKKQLAYFYVFVKYTNQAIEAQRPRR